MNLWETNPVIDSLINELERCNEKSYLWEQNAKDARSVIAMIRAMIGEMFGPVIESEEATLLRGPEPKHDGEAILEALAKIKEMVK